MPKVPFFPRKAQALGLSEKALLDQAEQLARGLDPRETDAKGWAALFAEKEPNLRQIMASEQLWAPRKDQGACDASAEDCSAANKALHEACRSALALKGAEGREAANRFAQTFGSQGLLSAAREDLDKAQKKSGAKKDGLETLGALAWNVLGGLGRVETPSVLTPWSQLAIERALRRYGKINRSEEYHRFDLGLALRACCRIEMGPLICDAPTAERLAQLASRLLAGHPHWEKEFAFAEKVALRFATWQAEGQEASGAPQSASEASPQDRTRRL